MKGVASVSTKSTKGNFKALPMPGGKKKLISNKPGLKNKSSVNAFGGK